MVKKLFLLELILAASFVLTGCQSGMELEINTADTVFSAVTESGAAPSKESEPTDNDENADESEPASGTAIKLSAAPSEEYAPQIMMRKLMKVSLFLTQRQNRAFHN